MTEADSTRTHVYSFASGSAGSSSELRPALFLDRDGTLNVDLGYVGSIERFIWIDGARETVRSANDAGFLVFVVTNQSGIGRGLYDEEAYYAVMRHMSEELAQIGAHLDDERHCPFHPEAKTAAFRRESDLRKPAPGMILDLLSAWPIDRRRSFIVGDRGSDVEAGRRAGIAGYRFPGGDLHGFVAPLLCRHSEEQ